MRKYKRKQKIVLLALSIVGVVISGWGIQYFMRTHRFQEAMQQLKIHEVDLSKIEDGEYNR